MHSLASWHTAFLTLASFPGFLLRKICTLAGKFVFKIISCISFLFDINTITSQNIKTVDKFGFS